MIEVTRLDNSKMMVNVDLIQSVRSTPDTLITFTTRDKIMVKESIEIISQKIVEYRKIIHQLQSTKENDNRNKNA
jgi:flagellar protein FlbD